MDYKEISKLFIEYDGDVQINPFAKMHWGILKTEHEGGKLYVGFSIVMVTKMI